jgi:hypothetical protein
MGSFVDPSTGNNLTATPAPAEPISKSVFDAYKATFRKSFRIQKMRGVLLPQWDDLWTMEFDNLRKSVLLRAPQHKKETYQEKILNDFAPIFMWTNMMQWKKNCGETVQRTVVIATLPLDCATVMCFFILPVAFFNAYHCTRLS